MFKERGALNSLLSHHNELANGVVAMSAGNHAQALAYHGRRCGVPTTIVMPRITPNAKVEATRLLGANVILYGSQFDETLHYTRELAEDQGMFLVHPFDAPEVIAGQGTVALEILSRALGLDDRIGSLEPGKRADIVLIDATGAHMTPLYDPFAALVYAATPADVGTVIVDGRIIVEDRRPQTADAEAIKEAVNGRRERILAALPR